MVSAVSCPGVHAAPPSASVRVTTSPLVPEMMFVPTLKTSTRISLPTALAVHVKPVVRVVQATETRLSWSGTSTRVKPSPRARSVGLESDTGTWMAVAPGWAHASPTASVLAARTTAGAASAMDNARSRAPHRPDCGAT